MIEILFIGFSLSADAFAVTLSNLLSSKNCKKSNLCPYYFGAFQGIMPLIGYFSANSFSSNVATIGNVIVFVLLSFIGVKMICDGFFKKDDNSSSFLTHKILIFEAFATSIDAFAVGVSLCFIDVNIYFASFTIALITFLMCFLAIISYSKIPSKFSDKFEIFGGLILIIIGVRALIF